MTHQENCLLLRFVHVFFLDFCWSRQKNTATKGEQFLFTNEQREREKKNTDQVEKRNGKCKIVRNITVYFLKKTHTQLLWNVQKCVDVSRLWHLLSFAKVDISHTYSSVLFIRFIYTFFFIDLEIWCCKRSSNHFHILTKVYRQIMHNQHLNDSEFMQIISKWITIYVIFFIEEFPFRLFISSSSFFFVSLQFVSRQTRRALGGLKWH